jgi:hypothetical protein
LAINHKHQFLSRLYIEKFFYSAILPYPPEAARNVEHARPCPNGVSNHSGLQGPPARAPQRLAGGGEERVQAAQRLAGTVPTQSSVPVVDSLGAPGRMAPVRGPVDDNGALQRCLWPGALRACQGWQEGSDSLTRATGRLASLPLVGSRPAVTPSSQPALRTQSDTCRWPKSGMERRLIGSPPGHTRYAESATLTPEPSGLGGVVDWLQSTNLCAV